MGGIVSPVASHSNFRYDHSHFLATPEKRRVSLVPAHKPTEMPGAKIKSSRRTRRPCGPSTELAKIHMGTTEPRDCHITGPVAKLHVCEGGGEAVAGGVQKQVLRRLHACHVLE